jgi:ribosomal protein L11 methyltransferase
VLDIGCGSGILGIASAKLGASKVLSLDNDSVCVKVTQDNARINGILILEALKSDLLSNTDNEKFDLILANIVTDVIVRLNKGITRYMKPDSAYIISGIIGERLEDVIRSLEQNGLEEIEILSMGEWRAVATRLKGNTH